jgi:hypothetical protein
MLETDAPAMPSTLLAPAEGSVAADEHRRPAPLEWVALIAGLVPVVATLVRAWAVDSMPTGDAAHVVVRSRVVLTSNHPARGT